jgi:hypothetical protein
LEIFGEFSWFGDIGEKWIKCEKSVSGGAAFFAPIFMK